MGARRVELSSIGGKEDCEYNSVGFVEISKMSATQDAYPFRIQSFDGVQSNATGGTVIK